MDEGKAFTIYSKQYSDLKMFVEDLHEDNRHYVPMVTPQIAQREGNSYDIYKTGVDQDVFTKAYLGGPDFTGKDVANDVVYPNFFQNQTTTWW